MAKINPEVTEKGVHHFFHDSIYFAVYFRFSYNYLAYFFQELNKLMFIIVKIVKFGI